MRTPFGGELGRPVAAAAYAFAVTMAGTTLPTPLYELYQRRIGFSTVMTTVVFAVYAVGVIAALVLLGGLSDAVGRRPVLLSALVLSAASALCFRFEAGLPELFAGRLLSGLSAGLATGTATVTVIELAPPRRRGRAALVATAANMGGLGSGPLLAGVLAQYGPAPLHLVFTVDLVLVAVAVLALLGVPETAPAGGTRVRLRRPRVPRETRPAFTSAAMAGFAGFATLGLFTSVAPSFLRQVLGVGNLAVAGAVVCSLFAASTAGQALMPRVGAGRALRRGCAALVAGTAAIAGSLAAASPGLLVLGALVAGAGQGLSFRAAVTAVAEHSPAGRRAEATSALFVAMYVAISLPVVGVGALAMAVGLRSAGLVFTGCVALLAAATAIRLPAPAGGRRGGRGRW